jgi:Uma2 family endonuclease
MSIPVANAPRPHRLTVDDYYRMGEAGILPTDARVELVDGEIFDMAPIGTRHAGTVDQLALIFQRAVGDLALVRTRNPVRLGPYSEPRPDLALVRPRADFYKSAHPVAEEILLVVEISDTSVRFDRDVKTSLYARHGIPEVWIVDLTADVLMRYRRPDAPNGVYADIDVPDQGEPLSLSALSGVSVDCATLFAASN